MTRKEPALHNAIFRRVFDLGGTELADELVAENHAVMMYNPMLEGDQPQSPADRPGESGRSSR